MNKFVTTLLSAAAAVVIGTSTAHGASLLAGDNVSLDFVDDGTTVSSWSGTIGAGRDLNPYSALSIDLNTGPAGDGFTITSNGTYCGLSCNGSTVEMIFTGLDFGTAFTVDNFVDTTGLSAFTTILSDTSFSITWTGAGGAHFFPGTVAFSGTFGTVTPIAVPLPLPAAMLGIAGFGLMAARRKSRSAGQPSV